MKGETECGEWPGGFDAGVVDDTRGVSVRDEPAPFDDHEYANDHFAVIYEDRRERLAATVPFLREGLDRGEKCLFVTRPGGSDREAVLSALRARDVDIERALEHGDLSLLTVEETYLRHETFDPDAMVGFYADVIEAVDERHDGMRVAAGMDWLEQVDFEAFMEYEGRVNRLFHDSEAKALCLYDRTQLSAAVIRDVIRTHPHLMFDDVVCDNDYYIPPDELIGPDRPEHEVDRMMNTLRERAQAKDELRESHARLEEFASAVSHDLRSPLTTVANYLQLLERRYDDELDEDAAEFIDFAVDGANRMREMIDGLVTTYAQVEATGDSTESVHLDAVLEETRRDLEAKIDASDAVITSTSLPAVRGDHGQLRQVLLNLLDNAIKYAGEEPPRVHVGARREGDQWMISVADEGIGMDPAMAESVFGVFERLHADDEYPGTGIGLALCERIVERHGGEIWVETEPGVGSTFSFTITAAQADR